MKNYQFLVIFLIFAKKNTAMKIEMDSDLKVLIETGQSRRYKDVARNGCLYSGLMRAHQKIPYFSGLSSVRLDNHYVHRLLFEEKEDKITLKLIEIDDTHYGNKK